MKKIALIILAVLFLVPTLCSAKPFINTAPTNSEVTEYTVTIEGVSHPVAPEVLEDGSVRLHYDIGPLGLSSGNHNITIKAINNLWDLETTSVPFVFSKPVNLEDPAGIGLSAN